jgi:hypothetical protein
MGLRSDTHRCRALAQGVERSFFVTRNLTFRAGVSKAVGMRSTLSRRSLVPQDNQARVAAVEL